MKKFIISSLALFALVNCTSSDDSPEENPVVDPMTIVPTKFTEITQDNQTYVIQFKYNGTKILESYDTGEDEKTVFTYNGDDIVKTEDYEGTTVRYIREFTYSNGRVASEKVTNTYSGTLTYTKTFQYLSDNHVKYNEYSGSTYNPITGVHTNLTFSQNDVYISNSKNLVSATSVDGGQTRTYTYHYDGQNSPFKNVRGYLKINLFMSLDGEGGNNNLTSQLQNVTGTVPGSYTTTGIHTYNNYNFPTKSLMTYTSPSFPTNTHTYLYEYNH